MKLILLHGRSQQKYDEKELRENWINALKSGLKKNNLELNIDEEDIIFPYYGKLLMELIDHRNSSDQVIEKGTGEVDDKFADFANELLTEVARSKGISDQKIAEIAGIDVKEKGVRNKDWFIYILRAIDSESSGAEFALRLFTNDVFHYLTNPIIGGKINEFVATHLPEPATHCVWVGHSLGSVISYNILSKYKTRNINEFITVGSPLGMKVIKKHLEAPLLMPPCSVNGWYNAFDKNDSVSLFPLEKPHFTINPAITNNGMVLNDTPDKHGISGYLSDKNVALRIYEALSKQDAPK